MAENDLQNLIKSTPPEGTTNLQPAKGEFPGPVIIDKSVTINGQGGTIWAKKGPVLTIGAHGVTIKDLSVEITGKKSLSGSASLAIDVEPGFNPILENVS